MNIGVATDDFGRDYGGLERIFKIQPDIIKLDRALISNIHLDPPRLAFVSGLVQSVRVIGAMTLAEGVELWEEAETLQAIGVELVQGYLLHRPQEAEVVLASLQTGAPPLTDASTSSSGAKVIPLKAG
jgi:EAL domain-containing protein (putative c-di-GMP-specific phosphodiesterase class I)